MPGKLSRLSQRLLFLAIVIYALAVAAFFVARFDGRWVEGDTARVTAGIAYAQQAGRVIPDPPGPAYPNGLAYPALSLFLMELGGVSVQSLQSVAYPFFIALLAFPLFVLYRALTNDTRVALFATFLMYLQPDFLFVTMRGSHEKVTWLLVMVALLLLAKSFGARRQLSVLVTLVLLFYLVVFSLVASNWFFAVSFIVTLALAFLGGSLLLYLRRLHGPAQTDSGQIRRLFFVTASCGILLYMFVYTIYPPAQFGLYVLGSMFERLAALLLNFDVPFNPYGYVASTWVSPLAYVALTMFNYTIGLLSLAVWLRGIPRFIRMPQWGDADLPRLFLWLIYPAFAIQMALSILIDFAGVLGGNFQVRLFTPLMLVAVPLAAQGVSEWLRAPHVPRVRYAASALLAVALLWFSAASLLKITNEPALSSQWTFYDASEQLAGAWLSSHIQATVWVGTDERVASALDFLYFPHAGVSFAAFEPAPDVRFWLLSALERAKYARLMRSPPDVSGADIIYDNGSAQIYFRPMPAK